MHVQRSESTPWEYRSVVIEGGLTGITEEAVADGFENGLNTAVAGLTDHPKALHQVPQLTVHFLRLFHAASVKC